MYQVQGQLHITNRQKCYFIVYTQCDLKYCIIEKDDCKYWYVKMIDPLEKFYMNAMLPEIIDSRNSRNLPIRSILKKDLCTRNFDSFDNKWTIGFSESF
jgi:hypothetical protein